jgi:hypothetical protein
LDDESYVASNVPLPALSFGGTSSVAFHEARRPVARGANRARIKTRLAIRDAKRLLLHRLQRDLLSQQHVPEDQPAGGHETPTSHRPASGIELLAVQPLSFLLWS